MKGITAIKASDYNLSEVFTLIFREQFVKELPLDFSNEKVGVRRSNFTLHTAFSFRATAKLLDLNWRFETLNRIDGFIETLEEKPRPILLAEWEWNHEDIFGTGKELEKLKKGVEGLTDADGLLLTYCPTEKYLVLLEEVVKYWQHEVNKKNFPLLYFITLGYKVLPTILEFQYLRTVQISAKEVILWDDIPFAPFLPSNQPS